jgi:hypothetical protein
MIAAASRGTIVGSGPAFDRGTSMRKRLLVHAAIALGCAGCAGIKVEPFDGTAATMKGVPYVLPMTVYTLTITRRVIGCDTNHIQGQVEVTPVAKKVPDPSAMFTLYSSGYFDTSDIKVGYDADGATNALNTSVTDQTATVITQSVTGLAKAAIAIGGAAAFDAAKANLHAGKGTACSDEVADAIEQIGYDKNDKGQMKLGLKDAVAKDTASLNDVNGQITLLSSQISTLGKNADVSLRKTLSDLLGKQHDLQTKLADEQQRLTKYLALVTDTKTFQWPKDGRQWQSAEEDELKLGEATWKKWAKPGADARDAAKFRVYLSIDRIGPWGQVGVGTQPLPKVVGDKGIPVRFPVPSVLHVCRFAPPPCDAIPDAKILDYPAPVLQFGLVYAVPATGGLFASTTFALQLDSNGAPSLVEVANQAAIAAGAATAASGALTQIAGVPAAIQAAKLASVTAQGNLVTAGNTLSTAQATRATIAQLAPSQAASALVQAQLAQVNAENSLAQAQAVNATAEQLAPIQADTALKQAQTSQLSAAAALAVANKANGSAP